MTDPKDTINIENIVASTGIDQELNFQDVAVGLEGVDYDPEQSPGLIYRTQEPKSVVLTLRSEEIVCTGTKSINDVHESLEIISGKLHESQTPVDGDPGVTMQNIITSVDPGESLDLSTIATGLGLESIEYEPEQFPGLVYRLDRPGVVALLFGSGELVVTGGERSTNAEATVDVIISRLSRFGLLSGSF